MDILLLGVDPPVKRFLGEHMILANPSKASLHSPSLEGEDVPRQGRWDLIVIDQKVKLHKKLVEAIKTEKIKGLKIVLAETENLHSEIEFWGTGIYSYFLKPIHPLLFQHVWQNALERIQLGRKLSDLQKQKKKKKLCLDEMCPRPTMAEHQGFFEDLLRAHLKLQELEQEKTHFLARATHDLRTPLTALQGYLSLMASEKAGSVSALQSQLLNGSLHSCARLLRLAQSLMDLSALGGSRTQLQLETGNMQECLQRATDELRAAAEIKRLQLNLDVDTNLPALRFDFFRMQQVFVNLLDNAVKFTPEGGKISVRSSPHFWERRTMREILETSRDRRGESRGATFNSVRIAVEDTGPGIPPEDLPEIFQEYRRGTNGNSSIKGFGLGLAVARQIVAAHEGAIWAECEPPSGSRFTVLIPTGL